MTSMFKIYRYDVMISFFKDYEWNGSAISSSDTFFETKKKMNICIECSFD